MSGQDAREGAAPGQAAPTPGEASFTTRQKGYGNLASPEVMHGYWTGMGDREREIEETAAQAAIAAAAARPAPGDEVARLREQVALLQADLADAEAQLARWPRCPAGCNCRVGIDTDPDANECGCDGPCNGGEQPFPAAQGALARVLSWFAEEPVVSSRRYASATRAQLAHAYQDGGLPVPDELRRFL